MEYASLLFDISRKLREEICNINQKLDLYFDNNLYAKLLAKKEELRWVLSELFNMGFLEGRG